MSDARGRALLKANADIVFQDVQSVAQRGRANRLLYWATHHPNVYHNLLQHYTTDETLAPQTTHGAIPLPDYSNDAPLHAATKKDNVQRRRTGKRKATSTPPAS